VNIQVEAEFMTLNAGSIVAKKLYEDVSPNYTEELRTIYNNALDKSMGKNTMLTISGLVRGNDLYINMLHIVAVSVSFKEIHE
jgi:hypothetical protein